MKPAGVSLPASVYLKEGSQSMMKPFLTGLFFCCCMTAPALAQHSFLNKLQKKEAGKGTVRVHQSDEISRLVNGADTGRTTAEKTKGKQSAGKQTTGTTVQRHDSSRHIPAEKKHQNESTLTEQQRRAALQRELDSIRAREAAEKNRHAEEVKPVQTEADRQRERRERYEAFVRAPKKKIRGYRVQVYAGDNTRKARQKAQSVAVQIKSYFPELAVYAHFVSPRWVCRAGDFRTYGEAQTYLRKIKAKKFREALIVKTTILVIAR